MKRVFITGDSPLVEEFATRCVGEKLTVSARANDVKGRLAVDRKVRWVTKPPTGIDIALELTNIDRDRKRKNLTGLDRLGRTTPIITSALTVTLAEQATWVKHPHRLVGIAALPSFLEGNLIEFSALATTGPTQMERARAFAATIGKESCFVTDMVGMILPRIVTMIINEAFFALSEGVAAAKGIDTAMRLGTNYPHGPVEWGEKIGFSQVLAVVSALHEHYGEDRYRPAPLLKNAARDKRLPV